MYLPAHFREDRPEVLHDFVRRHPFGALVTGEAARLTADHLPMELVTEPGRAPVLGGHVSRANPVWQAWPSGSPVLVIFGGADQYISPSWYATTAETGCVVPTWNYAVVHAHGTLRWIDDPESLHALVTRLTDHHEASRPDPWKVTDAPEAYVAAMVEAIVGFEIEVERLEGKFKSSQNRNEPDRAGVRRGLEGSGRSAADVAELLRSPHP
jgi:transcriptional regulator